MKDLKDLNKPGYLIVLMLVAVIVGISMPTLVKIASLFAYALTFLVALVIFRFSWNQYYGMATVRMDYLSLRDSHTMVFDIHTQELDERKASMNLAIEGPTVSDDGVSRLSKYRETQYALSPKPDRTQVAQAEAEVVDSIPQVVRLEDWVTPETARLDHLFLGVTSEGKPIYDDFRDMFHIAMAGTTRWGKSVLVQSLFTQFLWCAKEGIEFYLVDSGGTTFCDFGIPYVDEARDAELLLAQLCEELVRRKTLFIEAKAKNLNVYNAKTGEGMTRLVVVIEEGLDLLAGRQAMVGTIKRLVSWAAKYGLHIIFVSQSVKTSILDNDIRGNFSSKFQFRAEGRHQARILIEECEANHIKNRGRCFSVINGQPSIQMQTPIVSEETMEKAGKHYLEKCGPGMDLRDYISKIDPAIIDLHQYQEEVLSTVPVPQADPDGVRVCKKYLDFKAECIREGIKFSLRKATQEIYGEGKFGVTYNDKLRKTLDRHGIEHE